MLPTRSPTGLRSTCAVFLGVFLAARSSAQDVSVYVPAEDGTRLAVDVYLPAGLAADQRVPALFELTRYWRAQEDPDTHEPIPALSALDSVFLGAGYALLKVDVRGSGASFGTRRSEYGPQEVRDGHALVQWAVEQSWCDGQIGAFGTSYTGTTAELLTACGHPAVRAVVIGWSDFDTYRSPARPYGLYASGMIEEWSALVAHLDHDDTAHVGAGVRRVHDDEDGALLAAAVAEHADNFDVARGVEAAHFRDVPIGRSVSMAETAIPHWKDAIEASGAALLVFASWYDSGTAEGALERLRSFSNPQKLVMLASSHGGFAHASPFVVSRTVVPPVPEQLRQFTWQREFFDHHLKGVSNGVERWPNVRYHELGSEVLRESDVWPPEGARRERLHANADGALSPQAGPAGVDEYAVDFDVTTGRFNRWATQLGRPVLAQDDRGEMDERLLCYLGEPLEEPLTLAGTPSVHLMLAADREDCAILAYLEDVASDGQSRLLCEGGLRALHRKPAPAPLLDDGLPDHSFAQEDALPLVPGEPAEIAFRLSPIAVRVEAGHALRLALAGADKGTFLRLPEQGGVTLSVRHGEGGSYLELPVVPTRASVR